MNARQLLDFLKKPEGRFFIAIFLILILLALVWLFYGSKASQAKADAVSATFQKGKVGIEDLASDVPPVHPGPAKPSPSQLAQGRTNQPLRLHPFPSVSAKRSSLPSISAPIPRPMDGSSNASWLSPSIRPPWILRLSASSRRTFITVTAILSFQPAAKSMGPPKPTGYGNASAPMTVG